MTINSAQGIIPVFPVGTGELPAENGRVAPFTVNWSGTAPSTARFQLDLYSIMGESGSLSIIQSVFVDNSACRGNVTLYCAGSMQKIVIPPLSQAFVPIMVAKDTPLVITGGDGGLVAGSNTTTIHLCNMPMPFGIWQVAAPVSFGGTLVNAQAIAGGASFTSGNVTLPAGEHDVYVAGNITNGATPPATPARVQIIGAPTGVGTPIICAEITLPRAGAANEIVSWAPFIAPSLLTLGVKIINTDATNGITANVFYSGLEFVS